MKQSNKNIKVLNRLYKRLKKDENLFNTAADIFDGKKFKELFENYADYRNKFKEQIILEIKNLGGEPSNGSLPQLKEFWEKAKSMDPKRRRRMIIKKCHEIENRAIDDYVKVILASDIKLDTKDLLLEHYKNLRSTQMKLQKELSGNKKNPVKGY